MKRKSVLLGTVIVLSLLLLSYVNQYANALGILEPPTNLTARAVSSSEIDLRWTAPSDLGGLILTGYKIQRSTDGGSSWSTIVSNTGSTATTYSNTGLAPSTTYTYRIFAITPLVTSSPSNTASATTASNITAPHPPTGLTATAASSSQINLGWAAPTNNGGSAITGYKIYRSNSSGTETGYVSLGNVTSYTNTGLAPGVTYFYKVRAVNFAGVSPFSNEASATPYSITLVQSGLAGSDSLTNETRTKDQLLANQMYWHYGGSAQVENAPYDIFKDSQGLHIGVQSLANGTNWAGFYGVTPDTSAILFHSVVATQPRTLANQSSFYESGMYIQTSNKNVNYVTCTSDTSFWGTSWGVIWATGDAFGIKDFKVLYSNSTANQPLTRDCTIITNGDNYLKVYLDGTKVYENHTMNLQIPAPFNAFLEPQSSYAKQMFYGTYKDYYATTNENVTVTTNLSNAATVSIVDKSGNTLVRSPISAGSAILDVGRYHLPLAAYINVYDSNNMQIASTSSPVNIFGGDIYSVS